MEEISVRQQLFSKKFRGAFLPTIAGWKPSAPSVEAHMMRPPPSVNTLCDDPVSAAITGMGRSAARGNRFFTRVRYRKQPSEFGGKVPVFK